MAALYVDPRGPYPKLPDVDCWDESRDAREYPGPHPVVVHPPCGPWGALKNLCFKQDRSLAPIAVEQVRRFGGVLEHPAGSGLFRALRLPMPGELPDAYGGTTFEVEQVAWGHVARKRTWIYVVGVPREFVARSIRTGGTPTHWVSGHRRKTKRQQGGTVPAGVKVCSAQLRRRTPPAFAAWLVSLARAVQS